MHKVFLFNFLNTKTYQKVIFYLSLIRSKFSVQKNSRDNTAGYTLIEKKNKIMGWPQRNCGGVNF